MSVDSLITVFGLIIAIYSLLDDERRKKLMLNLSLFDIIIYSFIGLIIVYLVFFNIAKHYGITPGFGLYQYGIQIDDIYFIIFLLSIAYIFFRIKRKKVPLSKVDDLIELLFFYLQEEKKEKLSAILEEYSAFLISIGRANRKTWKPFIFIREIYKKYAVYDIIFLHKNSKEEESLSFKIKFIKWLFRKIRYNRFIEKKINSIESLSSKVHSLFRAIIENKKFIEFLAKNRPYFFIELYEIGARLRNELFREFLNNQFRVEFSALRNELRDSSVQILDEDNIGYEINQQNRLLAFFYSEKLRFDELRLCYSIVDILYTEIEGHDKSQKYLSPPDSFPEREKYDPIYLYLIMFDITVRCHIKYDVMWHSEVSYMKDIVSIVCTKIDLEKGEIGRPISTVYHDILYTIILKMNSWIKLFGVVEKSNLKIKCTEPKTNSNGSLSGAIIEAFTESVLIIYKSKNIRIDFKKIVISKLIDSYSSLVLNSVQNNYSKLFVNSILYYLHELEVTNEFVKTLDELSSTKDELFKDLKPDIINLKRLIEERKSA